MFYVSQVLLHPTLVHGGLKELIILNLAVPLLALKELLLFRFFFSCAQPKIGGWEKALVV